MDNILELLLGLVIAVVGATYTYDRRVSNRRFGKGERRMTAIETELDELRINQLENAKQHAVLQEKVDGLQQVVNVRFGTLSDSMNRIEDILARSIK